MCCIRLHKVFMSANRTGSEYAKVFYICNFSVQWDNVECKDMHLTACRKKGKWIYILCHSFCTFAAEGCIARISGYVKNYLELCVKHFSLHSLWLTHPFENCSMRLLCLQKIWVEFQMSIKVTFHFNWTVFLNSSWNFLSYLIFDHNKGNRLWDTRPRILQLSCTEIKCKGCIMAKSSILYMSVTLLTQRSMRFERRWPPNESNNLILRGKHREVSNQRLNRMSKALKEWSEGKQHCFSLQKTGVLDLKRRMKMSRAL